MTSKLLAIAAVACLAAFAWIALPPRQADAAAAFKNLQVLPKNITKDDLKAVMKSASKSLGVDCDFCHDTDDFSKDTDTKKTARGMMQMTIAVNKTYFGGKQVVLCATCHRGQKKPEALGPGATASEK